MLHACYQAKSRTNVWIALVNLVVSLSAVCCSGPASLRIVRAWAQFWMVTAEPRADMSESKVVSAEDFTPMNGVITAIAFVISFASLACFAPLYFLCFA